MDIKKGGKVEEKITVEVKKIPKRIVCVTQYEDDTFAFSFYGCQSRQEVKPLLDQCEREVRRRLNRGTPLCPQNRECI